MEAKRIARERGAFYIGQHDNPANPRAHEKTTAEELWRRHEGRIDVARGRPRHGRNPGGGRARAEARGSRRFARSAWSRSRRRSSRKGIFRPHRLMGTAPGFRPGVLDDDLVDEIVLVSRGGRVRGCRRIALTEGVVVGISSGATAVAAERLAADRSGRARRSSASSATAGSATSRSRGSTPPATVPRSPARRASGTPLAHEGAAAARDLAPALVDGDRLATRSRRERLVARPRARGAVPPSRGAGSGGGSSRSRGARPRPPRRGRRRPRRRAPGSGTDPCDRARRRGSRRASRPARSRPRPSPTRIVGLVDAGWSGRRGTSPPAGGGGRRAWPKAYPADRRDAPVDEDRA